MKPLLITSGEPSGIGPDVCLSLVNSPYPVVVLADIHVLASRAEQLGLSIRFKEYTTEDEYDEILSNSTLRVLNRPYSSTVIPGVLNSQQARVVLDGLAEGVDRCCSGECSGLVTAPVHKGIINDAGYLFTGHTEFFAERTNTSTVVMMLVCEQFKVALVTTHVPLRAVPDAITKPLLTQVIQTLDQALKIDFGLTNPCIWVAGLNPHAGESGHLGLEEITTITPVLTAMQQRGIDVKGPFPADTLYTSERIEHGDVFLAMYHDQGLPVLKYASFGQAVNVTLGLPFIRTSVDHGTALDLAGTGLASSTSLHRAVEMAAKMAEMRINYGVHHARD